MSNNHSLKVNDILYSSWGWEQTNIDFFIVTKSTKTGVTVQPIKAKKQYTGSMVGNKRPVVKFIDGVLKFTVEQPEKIRRKVFNNGSSEGIKIKDYMYAYKWDGRPLSFSEYA